MCCFAFCFSYRICIRIKIDTIWNVVLFASFYIIKPLCIILVYLIHSKSTSDNCKIYTICLHSFPIYYPLVVTNINSFCYSISYYRTITTTIFSCNFLPCTRKNISKWNRLYNWLSILITETICLISCLFCIKWHARSGYYNKCK